MGISQGGGRNMLMLKLCGKALFETCQGGREGKLEDDMRITPAGLPCPVCLMTSGACHEIIQREGVRNWSS